MGPIWRFAPGACAEKRFQKWALKPRAAPSLSSREAVPISTLSALAPRDLRCARFIDACTGDFHTLADHGMAAKGHFETKSDAYRCASFGLILLQELTFWRSASKVGA